MSTPMSHHVHKDSDPLPGASKDAPAPVDYSAPTLESLPSQAWKDTPAQWKDTEGHPPPHEYLHKGEGSTLKHGHPVLHSKEHEVKPSTGEEPPAVGGHEDHPEHKTRVSDKLVGKTQEIVGKVMDNAELTEKGQQRQAVGK